MNKQRSLFDRLVQAGFSEEEATKTENRWYNWLDTVISVGDTDKHFEAISTVMANQLVIVKDIDVDATCPHHILPVKLKVSIGYLPNGRVLGLSKFARIAQDINTFVMQEKYTEDLVTMIGKKLNPFWAMAYVEGEHMCMQCRGVKSKGSSTVTTAIFKHDEKAQWLKREFMDIVLK